MSILDEYPGLRLALEVLIQERVKCIIYGCQYIIETKPRECVRCGLGDVNTVFWGKGIVEYCKDKK